MTCGALVRTTYSIVPPSRAHARDGGQDFSILLGFRKAAVGDQLRKQAAGVR
jgi:hypothetical protein